jgi:aminomethyltransferase
MPVEYSGITSEHLAVRNAAGIFDVSHMGEFWVKGKNALPFLQYITTNNVAALSRGQAQYSCLPNGRGGLVDDIIVYRYEEEKYLVVVNAANIQKDWDWFVSNNNFGAELENASDHMSIIALQGPKSGDILQHLVHSDIKSLKGFHFITETIPGAGDVIISATGYTGSGGFELFCYNEYAGVLWDILISQGKAYGLVPAGLASRDTLRLEMGYSLYGNDIDDTTSPVEAGLNWIIKLKPKDDFIGRTLIEKQMTEGVQKKMTGVLMLEKAIPRKGYIVYNAQGQEIGIITSGTMSPVLQKGIGMAYILTRESNPGNQVYVKIREKLISAAVVKFPFISK